MKKRLIIIAILLILLTGCGNKKIINSAEENVNEKIADYRNVTESSIKESLDYIEDNYKEKLTNSKKENLLTNAYYLKELSKNNKESNVYKLSISVEEYVLKNKNKKDIDDYLDKINKNKNTEITTTYKSYLTKKVIAKKLSEQERLVNDDINDKTQVSKKNVSKALEYIDTHINNVLLNEEVIEKMAYYTLYLNELSNDDGLISKISKETLEYLDTLDDNHKNKVIDLINDYKKNESKELNYFFSNIK